MKKNIVLTHDITRLSTKPLPPWLQPGTSDTYDIIEAGFEHPGFDYVRGHLLFAYFFFPFLFLSVGDRSILVRFSFWGFRDFPFFAFDSLCLFPLFRPLDEETVLFADECFVQHIVLEITLTAAAQPEAKESRRTWMEQFFTRVKLPAYQPQGSITLGHVSRCCLLLMCSSSRGEVMWGTYSTSE